MPSESLKSDPGATRALPCKIDDYQGVARELSKDEFTHRFPYPFVLFSPNALLDDAMRFANQQGLSSEGTNIASLDVMRGTGQYVSPVVKKVGHGGEDNVFLGREKSNDIVVPVRSISNQHCKFAPPGAEGEKWLCRDLASKNGLFVDGQRMIPGAAYELKNGSRIELGQDIVVWFVEPAAMWEMLREPDRLQDFFKKHG